MLRNLIKWFSRIHIPCSRKLLSEKEISNLVTTLRDGDVVLTHVRGELTNLGLSYWSHAGIFYQGKMYESTTSGVHPTDTIYFFAKKDAVKVLRPTFEIKLGALYTFLNSNLNKPYDYDFKDSDKEFYCFELVARSFYYSTIKAIVLAKKRTLLGEKFLASTFENNVQFQEILMIKGSRN